MWGFVLCGFFGLLGAVIALGLSTAANADSITALPPGDLGPAARYGLVATFDDLAAQPYGSTISSGSLLNGGAAFSGWGWHEQRRPRLPRSLCNAFQ
jgi:hypothetical protein